MTRLQTYLLLNALCVPFIWAGVTAEAPTPQTVARPTPVQAELTHEELAKGLTPIPSKHTSGPAQYSDMEYLMMEVEDLQDRIEELESERE